MLKTVRILAISTAWAALCAFTAQKTPAGLSQPAEERQAQESLPQSKDAVWATLLKTTIHVDEKRGLYSATYPAEVKALAGQRITVTGFMLPVETTMKFKHFILAKRTPTCPYCPPGEPNEIIDIRLDKNVAFTEKMLHVTGTFGFMNNQQFGMFFRMDKATVD